MGSSHLRISTLGSFAAHLDGRPLPFERSKTKALLAFLCINSGRVFTREYLADLLWGDTTADKSRHSLSQALYSIRRISPSAITVTANTVESVPSVVSTDLIEVSDLVREWRIGDALSLVRGEFLGDLSAACGTEFDQWRSNTNRDFFARLDAEVVHAITGRPKIAAEQLGVRVVASDLLPKTTAILRRFDTVTATQAPVESVSADGIEILPFVGRDHQLQQLTTAWTKCTHGCSQSIAIVGQPGHGKTRLAHEFLDRIEPTKPLKLEVACYESESAIGFSVASDLIKLLLREADVSRLQQIWIDAVADLLPSGHGQAGGAPVLSPGAAQIRLFESVRHILRNIAHDRNVVVLIDDVQWCDKSSQALFAHLSHRLQECKVLLLATIRERTLKSAKEAPWAEWENVLVPELTESDVAAVLKSLSAEAKPSAVSPHDLCQYTGGNPYFITELLRNRNQADVNTRSRASLKPGKGSRLFLSQLIRHLPQDCQQCLVALSVIRRPVSLRMLRVVARVKSIDKAVTELLASGFVVMKNRKISLKHDLLRHSVYSQTPILLRSELHRRFAKIVAEDEHRAGEAALHFSKCGSRRQAHTFALRAAQQADTRYANQESIALLQIALKARPSAMMELAPLLIERLHRAHRYEETRVAIRRLGAHANGSQEIPLDLQVLDLDLSREMGLINGPTLRTRVGELKSSLLRTHTAFRIAATRVQIRSAFHDGDRDAMLAAAAELRILANEASGPEGYEALALAGRVHATVQSAFEARKWLAELQLNANSIQEHERRLRILSMIAAVEYECGFLESAVKMHEVMLAEIERIGAMSLWPLAACHMHMVLVEKGDYVRAETLSATAMARAIDVGAKRELFALQANRAGMLYEVGDYGGALAAAETALTDMSWTASVWIELGLRALRGLSALELGKVKDASETSERIAETLAGLGFRACDISHAEILLARLSIMNKRPDAAIARLSEAVADYAERDVVCRLRLQLELARTLKPVDRAEARRHAKEVYEKACAINARPLADRADSLLHRL